MNDDRNFSLILDEMLESISKLEKKPKLLLHSCCAPCSSYVLEYLSKYFEITILYYNPNIYPFEEYQRRKDELIRFVEVCSYSIPIIEKPYLPEEYHQAVLGLEELGEKSKRCFCCYELRMKEAAKYAKEHHFDYFTTTLSISPHKNATKINEIGEKLEKEFGVSYLYADFKKKNGYKRSLELSKEYHLYRQDYCGCVYSMRKRQEYENSKNCSR